tara:strand:- start:1576 stop:2079 length:504 start_codon:yes stop_codon:yes gene_type:complete
MTDPTPVQPMTDGPEDTNHLAVYLSGLNAETYERGDDPSADSDGHVINGTIIRRPEDPGSIVPVRVRIGHGVSSQTAARMLRKMAEMLEKEPDFLSDRAGAAIRRMPDGTATRKQLTVQSMLEVAEQLGEEEKQRLIANLPVIRVQIDDHKTGPGGWQGGNITGPGV